MIAVALVLIMVAASEEDFLWLSLAGIASLGSVALHLGALL